MMADRLPYWIQRADLSSTDFEPVGIKEATAVLLGHDWASELALQDRLERAGADECPPGVGFHRPDAPALTTYHACPNHDGTWFVHYHFAETRPRKGLFFGRSGKPSSRPAIVSAFDLRSGSTESGLRAFFNGDHAAVLRELEVGG